MQLWIFNECTLMHSPHSHFRVFCTSTFSHSQPLLVSFFDYTYIINGKRLFSARRANFFSAVGKIFNLVSGFWEAKKWAQNRNWNENLPCIENIARCMSKKRTMEVFDPCRNVGYDDRCWNHWLRKESNVVQLWIINECTLMHSPHSHLECVAHLQLHRSNLFLRSFLTILTLSMVKDSFFVFRHTLSHFEKSCFRMYLLFMLTNFEYHSVCKKHGTSLII